jgi:ribosomal protein S14
VNSPQRLPGRWEVSPHAGCAGTPVPGHNPGTRPGSAPGTTHADRRDSDCMNETCDRCGPAVRAVYRAERTGELYLCRHCGNRLGPALYARGWTMWTISEHALAR